MKQATSAIEIRDLSYAYKDNWSFRRIPRLHGITLDVFTGESFGFLGHNGAGKTTTIKCLLGLIRPWAGTIKIFGQDAGEVLARKSVGYVPEQPYFYDHLSVQEIMEMYALLAGVPAGEVKSAVAKALARVHLSGRERSKMRTLSKGLTQRVALAQAIIANPRLLVLDEPFSGLDPIGRKEIRDLLFELKQEGVTIFMCSHVLSDVEYLCDRVSIMAAGALKGVFDLKNLPSDFAQNTFELVVRNYGQAEAALKSSSLNAQVRGPLLSLTYKSRAEAEAALKVALEQGAEVESFESQQPGLEEIFVKLVSFKESTAAGGA